MTVGDQAYSFATSDVLTLRLFPGLGATDSVTIDEYMWTDSKLLRLAFISKLNLLLDGPLSSLKQHLHIF